jgi:hypothetical protein
MNVAPVLGGIAPMLSSAGLVGGAAFRGRSARMDGRWSYDPHVESWSNKWSNVPTGSSANGDS